MNTNLVRIGRYIINLDRVNYVDLKETTHKGAPVVSVHFGGADDNAEELWFTDYDYEIAKTFFLSFAKEVK